MNTFEKHWEDWIDLNLGLNNCKKIMFQKSIEAGYTYDLIKKKLGIDYIVNPQNSTDSDKISLRTAEKINARNLEIYRIPNFLNSEECDNFINIINNSDLKKSTVYEANAPTESLHRTSKTCYFKDTDIFTIDVESRICKTLGINNRFSEKIQGQKYAIGDEFKNHTDTFDQELLPTTNGQRTWTFMIFLNEVTEGGYTSFPYAYTAVKPEKGMALIWNSLNTNKSMNVFSTHCGMPVLKGEKYILTKWFREKQQNMDIKNEICKNHFLSIFHPVGFEKLNLKLESVEAIKNWMKTNESKFIKEIFPEGKEENGNVFSNILTLDAAPKELITNLNSDFKEILTKWINHKSVLTHSATYGIREYLKGSALYNHYDTPTTHVISAIVHLDSDKPWDLNIEDHHFRKHNITMEYGDIVIYESTTCLHGRPTKYDGESYRNMYLHFRPDRW